MQYLPFFRFKQASFQLPPTHPRCGSPTHREHCRCVQRCSTALAAAVLRAESAERCMKGCSPRRARPGAAGQRGGAGAAPVLKFGPFPALSSAPFPHPPLRVSVSRTAQHNKTQRNATQHSIAQHSTPQTRCGHTARTEQRRRNVCCRLDAFFRPPCLPLSL